MYVNKTNMGLHMRKSTILVSKQLQHKLVCAVTEDRQKLEILYLSIRGIVKQNKGTDHMRSYCTADLHLCFPVADLEGVRGVHSNPPLGPNYFIFIGKFTKTRVKCRKRTPFGGFEPPSHNSWIRPCFH